MPKQNKSVDLDFTGIFSKADFKPAPPPPIPLPDDVVVGANALKKGGYFVNLTHPRAQHIASPSAATVLIVEDDPSTLMLLDRLLTRAGYRTRMASSGATFVATTFAANSEVAPKAPPPLSSVAVALSLLPAVTDTPGPAPSPPCSPSPSR